MIKRNISPIIIFTSFIILLLFLCNFIQGASLEQHELLISQSTLLNSKINKDHNQIVDDLSPEALLSKLINNTLNNNNNNNGNNNYNKGIDNLLLHQKDGSTQQDVLNNSFTTNTNNNKEDITQHDNGDNNNNNINILSTPSSNLSSSSSQSLENDVDVSTSIKMDTLQIIPSNNLQQDNLAPRIARWEPLGFIPLKRRAMQDVYLLDILTSAQQVEEKDVIQDLLLDTTSDALLLWSQQACDGMNPPQQDCATLTLLFNQLSNRTFYVDSQIIKGSQCFVAPSTVAIPWSVEVGQMGVTALKIDAIACNKVEQNGGWVLTPAAYNLFPFRGIFGLARPRSTQRPLPSSGIDADYQWPLADLLSTIMWQKDYDTKDQRRNTTWNYGLDLYLSTEGNSTAQYQSTTSYYNLPTVNASTAPLSPNNTPANTIQSRLYLNGVPRQYRDKLQWTVQQPVEYLSSSSFRIFDVSFCGIPMYSGIYVLVDTMSPCLTVPSALFDAIAGWVPMQCDFTTSPPSGRQCYVRTEDLKNPTLPSLSFRMSKTNRDGDSPTINIPLDALLMPASRSLNTNFTDTQRVCLTSSWDRMYISIGNVALSSLYYHVDYESNRYAFANKVLDTPTNNQCIPRLQCTGQESSYAAYNYCYAPDCSRYFFFSYNKNTKTCDISPAYPIILAIFFAIFLAAEFTFWLFETRLEYRVTHDMPKMALINRSRTTRQSPDQNTGTNDTGT